MKRENYINSQWQKIFPGKLGRFYALIYSAYLTDPIDSQEKKQAWQAFIDQLDKIEEIEIPAEIDEFINSSYFEKILEASEKTLRTSSVDENEISLPPTIADISPEMVDFMKMMAKFKKFVTEELDIYLLPMAKYLEILSNSCKRSKEHLAISLP